MSRLYLANPCALFRYFRTRCCGRSRRPAFPAPFRCKGPLKMQQPGRDRAAGMLGRDYNLSSPGLTGRPSIPEASVIEPKGRGVLDHPLSRV